MIPNYLTATWAAMASALGNCLCDSMRFAIVAGLLTLGLIDASPIRAQSAPAPAPPLSFEVASIKPSKPGDGGGGIKPMSGGQGYIATNVPVKLIIKLMFHLNDRQISGDPPWLDTDLYDIEAKADGPHNVDDLHVMFQNLLVDRFKLQFHKETRVLSAYELVVDKSDPS